MKILQLCNRSPYPPIEGGVIGMYAVIEGLLHAGHQVKVLAFNTNKFYVDPDGLPPDFREKTGIEYVGVDLSIKPWDALMNLFSKESLHIKRFDQQDYRKALERILKETRYDIVQLEYLHMTPYVETIRRYSNAAIILHSHNIEHLVWERMTASTSNPLKKAYLKGLTRKLRNYELSNLNTFDGIVTVSKNDAGFFSRAGCMIPIIDIPFIARLSEYGAGETSCEFPSLFHIGAMNWKPNIEGIAWFLDEVWPHIHRRFPSLKLYLAGRFMPGWIAEKQYPQVVVVGEVPDAKDFIQSKGIMVAPLLSGSGIRIKILESMALARPVIATTIGAEGIPYTAGKNILIADKPEEFTAAIGKCIADRAFCEEVGRAARELIEEEYQNEACTGKLVAFYQRVLDSRKRT
jgi:glycosyltransferase involved in cell wall biosynthesis